MSNRKPGKREWAKGQKRRLVLHNAWSGKTGRADVPTTGSKKKSLQKLLVKREMENGGPKIP